MNLSCSHALSMDVLLRFCTWVVDTSSRVNLGSDFLPQETMARPCLVVIPDHNTHLRPLQSKLTLHISTNITARIHNIDTQSLPTLQQKKQHTIAQQTIMEFIPENIALSDLPPNSNNNRRSSSNHLSGTHSAPSRLQNIYPRPRPTSSSPDQTGTLTPTSTHYHADRSRASSPNDTSTSTSRRSSSTYVAVPTPHLGSVSRVPRRLQHLDLQYPHTHSSHDESDGSGDNSGSNSSRQTPPSPSHLDNNNNTANVLLLRSIPYPDRHAYIYRNLLPTHSNSSNSPSIAHPSSPIEEAITRADSVNSNANANANESVKSSDHKPGFMKRCLNSFLQCWFGWEDGEVYYGEPPAVIVGGKIQRRLVNVRRR
jgi:hypothetical protein